MKRPIALVALLLASVVAPSVALAAPAEQQAYVGSHVSFETESNAIVDYRVDGETAFDDVRVQSQSALASSLGIGVGVDAEAIANMTGAEVSVDARADANATVETESGARIEAHDNGHGSLVVVAEDESQYVALNVSGGADVQADHEDRIVFTTEDGATATAMIVGEGSLNVSESGELTASVESDSRLVVRVYGDSRTAADDEQEALIVDGEAAASVYVMTEGNETVSDTVTYEQETTIDVSHRSDGQLNMTVSRTAHEGRVVITHVGESTIDAEESVSVSVSGEAAARASSYTEIRSAADGGSTSKFLVEQSSSASAEAAAEVVVGVNHFSTRSLTVENTGDADASAQADVNDDSTDEGEESTPADEGDESTPADEGDESTSNDRGESTPADEDDESTPADEGDESTPNDRGESTPANESDESTPADESDESTPADESDESTPADESDESTPADEGDESTPADEDGGDGDSSSDDDDAGVGIDIGIAAGLLSLLSSLGIAVTVQ